MELNELIEEQERCRNRLYDGVMQIRYLAIQKRINELASEVNLEIDDFSVIDTDQIELEMGISKN